MPIRARYHDGKTAWQSEVRLSHLPPDRLLVQGQGLHMEVALRDVRASSRIGNMPRQIAFADGSQCETDDNDAIDALFVHGRVDHLGRLLHRWESRLPHLAGVVLLAAAALWAGLEWGVPVLAREVALRLPRTVDQAVGQGALNELDRALLAPSRLGADRQAQLQTLFAEIVKPLEGAPGYRLELRTGKRLGANALALPSGIVVLTDELIALAQSDAELRAVLAHEVGHVELRHGLRRVLQASAMPLILVAVTGDLGAVFSMASLLPTLLVQKQYSRDFEREADDFARRHLDTHRIPARSLSDLLARIEKSDRPGSGLPPYFSTHPSTSERAARLGGKD